MTLIASSVSTGAFADRDRIERREDYQHRPHPDARWDKRVKKLRYALQFIIALLPDQNLKTYQKELVVIQNLLGEINDLTTALSKFTALKDLQPEAWFACGWISNRLTNLEQETAKAFEKFEKNRYWR